MKDNTKKEFWETSFTDKQEMWGFEPAKSAIWAKDFFLGKAAKSILIPGIGYGRNAQIFREHGIGVTGIEISETAIALARRHYGADMTLYHGSVTDMPFDDNVYDGIFCHGLIYLLEEAERVKLIQNCYKQLIEGGTMIFTVITKEAKTYGLGTQISKDRFEMFGGVQIFFYDEEAVHGEFAKFGLVEIKEVNENYPFYVIRCSKTGINNSLEPGVR
ncbi:class I SAM-dependent methyltransferase [Sphingobacterium olei]|uniref:Class I SAM-dependent methyltransferase n=1 Tax=Sphingobacterium olei TaxID=2571155 RepID=A0A4U0P6S2_9SPHI|nr:class I SAM-dependent methyltransferase [Sphingobacterium olei]TJZ63049.1 class I SAM-dependent methyltransferase [Sphingobacterium olei]